MMRGCVPHPSPQPSSEPQLPVCSPSLQVKNTITDELFLHEAHVHALANMKEQTIIVVQPGKKPQQPVTLTRYLPGWKQPDTVTRQQMLELMKLAPLLIHLNQPPTHFSAILPIVARTRPSKRKFLQSVGSSTAGPVDLSED